MSLSIIVPAHNEEENIAKVVEQIELEVIIPHELIVVNDHSSDQTGAILDKLCLKFPNLIVIRNHLEKGFANAIRAGFLKAKGDALLPVMGDLCDDLSIVGKMYQRIEEGFDVVCGSRYIKSGARVGGSHLKALLSCWAGSSLYYLLGIPTHDIANAFKMYRNKVIKNITINARGFEISMEITLKAYYQGFKVTEIPTIWHEREKGKSNFKIFKLLPDYMRLYFWALGKRIFR